MLKWEDVSQDNSSYLRRAPVFGGWLIQTIDDVNTVLPDWSGSYPAIRNDYGHEWRTSITFMPDPNHEWDSTKDYSNE